ncbi:hypothetical protein EGW08_008607, partial [Elysia chlorotica]
MLHRKTSKDIFVVVMATVALMAALTGGTRTQENNWSNSTRADSPRSVNSTDLHSANSPIGPAEVYTDANSTHVLVISSKSGEPCLLAALNATIQVSYKVLEGIVHEGYV